MSDHLSHLADMIVRGEQIPADVATQVISSLSQWQVKMDLFRIGTNLHLMTRLAQLSTFLGEVEGKLHSRMKLGVLQNNELISLLKSYQQERGNIISHLSEQSMKPVLSSGDSMKGLPTQSSVVVDAPKLNAASRERVRKFLQKLIDHPVDATVISEHEPSQSKIRGTKRKGAASKPETPKRTGGRRANKKVARRKQG